ncbi:MAG: methyltransferase domain-containing protein [Nanoarchaeota archaeon]|nr:methyltransferase domain-containing protein [Nanoarchaeota archaeon]
MIKKILITPDNKMFFVRDTSKDYHTHFGIVSKSDLEKEGIIKTNTDKELSIFTPTRADLQKKIKRGAAIVLPKDAGYIIAETGLNKESMVLDAGAGSGALAITLSNTAKHVYTYENNDKHYKIAKFNIEDLEIKNITIENKDLKEAKEKVDLITLDLPQPWDYLDVIELCLKPAGFVVTYLPTTSQVQEMVKISGLRHIKTIELLEREWHIDGRRVRPKSQMIAHTAFLSFFRKI